MDLYAEIRSWQAGIGALLGFLALLVAALWNYHLNRKRDTALRREETLSIAVALYSEILLLRNELAELARAVAHYQGEMHDRSPDQFTRDYGLSEPMLYPALGGKLGLLPAELVLAITRFHVAYSEAKDAIPRICAGGGWNILTTLRPTVSGVQDVEPALRQIESLAHLPKASDPDLRRVIDVIEMKEVELQPIEDE